MFFLRKIFWTRTIKFSQTLWLFYESTIFDANPKTMKRRNKKKFFRRNWLWTCRINFLKACHFLKKVPILHPTSARSRKIFFLKKLCIYSKTSSGLMECIFNKLAGRKLIKTLKISEQSPKIIMKLITKSEKRLEHFFAKNRRQFLQTCQTH